MEVVLAVHASSMLRSRESSPDENVVLAKRARVRSEAVEGTLARWFPSVRPHDQTRSYMSLFPPRPRMSTLVCVRTAGAGRGRTEAWSIAIGGFFRPASSNRLLAPPRGIWRPFQPGTVMDVASSSCPGCVPGVACTVLVQAPPVSHQAPLSAGSATKQGELSPDRT